MGCKTSRWDSGPGRQSRGFHPVRPDRCGSKKGPVYLRAESARGACAARRLSLQKRQKSAQIDPPHFNGEEGGVAASAQPIADPVARARPEAGGAVAWVGKLTAIEREAAATDALGEPELQALELGDALVEPRPPHARET
jgi:hypothetical protein